MRAVRVIRASLALEEPPAARGRWSPPPAATLPRKEEGSQQANMKRATLLVAILLMAGCSAVILHCAASSEALQPSSSEFAFLQLEEEGDYTASMQQQDGE